MLKEAIQNRIRNNRRNRIFSGVARFCRGYLNAYNNVDYWNFERNGEAFLMERFNDWQRGRPCEVWDVGAHFGEWADAAAKRIASPHIDSFEILPSSYRELCERTRDRRIAVHNFGLSDRTGPIDVFWSKDFETTSSISPREGSIFFDRNVEVVRCEVRRGDDIWRGGVSAPNFLKIDTEGHDVAVLRGLAELLAEEPPALIQFEYGDTYIPSRFMLKDAYDLLTPLGYSIGKLYPRHVEFAAYSYRLDDFKMCNVVAVRDEALRSALN